MKEFTLKNKARLTRIPESTLRDFLQRKVMPSQGTINKIDSIFNAFCIVHDVVAPKETDKKKSRKEPQPKTVTLENKKPTGKLSKAEISRRLTKLGIKKCPVCGRPVEVKYSKIKDNQFIGCTGFKTRYRCRYTKDLVV